ncbi:MAG: hypothetical protein ACREP9_05715 [Candidatus Dormibacteraceae bacterium]
MIQGVHAETIVFARYEQASSFVLARSLPSVGISSQFGGREVELRGSKSRPFRVRVTDVRERSRKTISCQLELHDVAHGYAPLMRVELSFIPDGTNTRVDLKGSAARDLTPGPSAQTASSRGLANEYARALLEQIAKAIEGRSVEGGRSPRPRGAE